MSLLRPYVLSWCALAVLAEIGPAWAILPPQSILKAQARVDVHGDLLPPGALARLGQVDRSRHGSPIHCLAVSRDGKWVATGGTDGNICLWDAATTKEIRTWPSHRGVIQALTFAPDGKTLASAGTDQKVFLWDVATGKQTLRLVGFTRSFALAFAPDGKSMASGGHPHTGTVQLWELVAGTNLETFIHYYQPVKAMTFTADGQGLIAGGEDKKVRYWSKKTGKEVRSYDRHRNEVTAIALAPDGKTIASGDADGVVHVWETATARPIQQWQAHQDAVAGLTYSPDGKFLASSSYRQGVVLWSVGAWKLHKEYHLSQTNGVGFAGGHWLYAASHPGRLHRWDLTAQNLDKQPLQPDRGPIRSVVFRKEGSGVVTLSNTSWQQWDANTMKLLAKTTTMASGHPLSRAAAPQADRIALAIWQPKNDSQGCLLRLVQVSTGKELRTWATPQVLVHQLCFAADGKTLASVSSKEVFLWNSATGKQQGKFSMGGEFWAVSLSGTGRWFAAAPRAGAIHVWDVFAKTAPVKIGGDAAPFVSLTFAPDGRTLATLSLTGRIQFWDLTTGGEGLFLQPQPVPVLSPADLLMHAMAASPKPEEMRTPLLFSPDGRWFAVGWLDRSVRVFDLATGTEAGRFTGHKDNVTALAWRTDGLVLGSGSCDSTTLLWDVKPLASKPLGPDVANRPQAWEELGSGDAQVGHRAIWALVAQPRFTLALLEKRLQPQVKQKKSVAELVAELDSPRFPVRDQANWELKKRGAAARPALQEALAKPNSLEVRRRLEKLLQALADQPHSPEELRLRRAVEVLERIGTDEARALLGRLAKGADDGSLNWEARNALERMGRRWSTATP